MIIVGIVAVLLVMLALAAGGMALIVRSGESISKTRREWKEMDRQRAFYKANPGASQADYIQHYLQHRNEELHRPHGGRAPSGSSSTTPADVTASAPSAWTHSFPSEPSRVRTEGVWPNLVLRWDASRSTQLMDYYRVWFYDSSGETLRFVDVDANPCSLPLGDLLDPAIPERFVEITGTDVSGQRGMASRRLRIVTAGTSGNV